MRMHIDSFTYIYICIYIYTHSELYAYRYTFIHHHITLFDQNYIYVLGSIREHCSLVHLCYSSSDADVFFNLFGGFVRWEVSGCTAGVFWCLLPGFLLNSIEHSCVFVHVCVCVCVCIYVYCVRIYIYIYNIYIYIFL